MQNIAPPIDSVENGPHTSECLYSPGFVISNADMGFPVDKGGLCFSVKKILDEMGNSSMPFINNKPRRKWFEAFLRRHPQLSVKQAEFINRARVTPEKIKFWFQDVSRSHLGDDVGILEDPARVWRHFT